VLEKVSSYFQNQKSLEEDSKLLVAISGGRDSVALAHVLHTLGFQIGLAHVNFQLRGRESDGDEDFLKSFAEQLGVPLYIHSENPEEGKNVQQEARRIRYAFFKNVMKNHGYSLLTTAHHQDDKIETALLNFTRGTGIHGMRGMISSEAIYRPLLGISRIEIDQYLDQEGLLFREDSSNATGKYKRNKLRNEVLPVLLTLEPDTRDKVLASIQNLEFDSEAIAQMGDMFLVAEHDILKIDLQKFPEDTVATWLYHTVRKFNFNRQQCVDLVRSDESGAKVSAEQHTLYRQKDEVHVVKNYRSDFEPLVFERVENRSNASVEIQMSRAEGDDHLAKNNWSVRISFDSELFPITIRSATPEDRFNPLGMKHDVKLTDYLKDKGIPKYNRLRTPVACDADGRIFWVPGIQISEAVKLKDTDSQSLSISFFYL
jgi:tRNA(Ile)-lysidine synthase